MFLKSSQSYQPVPNEDEKSVEPCLTENLLHNIRGNLGRLILALILISTIIVTSTIIESYKKRGPTWSSCGNTPETARQRRCSFDLISFAWQTPECYDSDLVSEFASWEEESEWTFYAEKNVNASVTQDVALVGEHDLFVTWHYHMVHCTFMWRQMHRAYERGWIDAHLHSYNHTLHCQKALLRQGAGTEDTAINTVARVIYPVCDRVGKDTGSSAWDTVYASAK